MGAPTRRVSREDPLVLQQHGISVLFDASEGWSVVEERRTFDVAVTRIVPVDISQETISREQLLLVSSPLSDDQVADQPLPWSGFSFSSSHDEGPHAVFTAEHITATGKLSAALWLVRDGKEAERSQSIGSKAELLEAEEPSATLKLDVPAAKVTLSIATPLGGHPQACKVSANSESNVGRPEVIQKIGPVAATIEIGCDVSVVVLAVPCAPPLHSIGSSWRQFKAMTQRIAASGATLRESTYTPATGTLNNELGRCVISCGADEPDLHVVALVPFIGASCYLVTISSNLEVVEDVVSHCHPIMGVSRFPTLSVGHRLLATPFRIPLKSLPFAKVETRCQPLHGKTGVSLRFSNGSDASLLTILKDGRTAVEVADFIATESLAEGLRDWQVERSTSVVKILGDDKTTIHRYDIASSKVRPGVVLVTAFNGAELPQWIRAVVTAFK